VSKKDDSVPEGRFYGDESGEAVTPEGSEGAVCAGAAIPAGGFAATSAAILAARSLLVRQAES
jgi:hypothetical protein